MTTDDLRDLISRSVALSIDPKRSPSSNLLNNLVAEMKKGGINTQQRICSFLAQIAHESGHFKYREENLNYGPEGLMKTFKKYFPDMETATKYARNPQKIASRVYANRMGNGDELSGDGWKYRGRGLIQLTGRDSYSRVSRELYPDCPYFFTNDPSLVASDEHSPKISVWFWNSRSLNPLADKENIEAITRAINGGLNGFEDRKALYAKFMEQFKPSYLNFDS